MSSAVGVWSGMPTPNTAIPCAGSTTRTVEAWPPSEGPTSTLPEADVIAASSRAAQTRVRRDLARLRRWLRLLPVVAYLAVLAAAVVRLKGVPASRETLV